MSLQINLLIQEPNKHLFLLPPVWVIHGNASGGKGKVDWSQCDKRANHCLWRQDAFPSILRMQAVAAHGLT